MTTMESGSIDVKQQVQRHWDGRADDFDTRPNHGLHSEEQRHAWLDLLRGVIGPAPQSVLDLGCGTGFLSLLLAELGHQVTGVDLAPRMLAAARQKADEADLTVELRLGDAEKLTDPDDRYALVVARHLIWTLPDPARAVQEWRRVLRPGGRVALFEGRWEQQTARDEYEPIHGQLPFFGGLPGEQLAEFLRGAGWREVVVRPLMEAALWGETPRWPRYLALATA